MKKVSILLLAVALVAGFTFLGVGSGDSEMDEKIKAGPVIVFGVGEGSCELKIEDSDGDELLHVDKEGDVSRTE